MAYVPTYHDVNVTYSINSTANKATVHYIEAGDAHFPTLLLLHGFPSSSIQYRDLIPLLSDQYHVIAPDYPGFGLTKVADNFAFTFANITTVIAAWLAAIGVAQTALYIHDYGAPVGLRLAINEAINVTAIVTQNGNAYTEGFGQDFWAPVFDLWNTSNSAAARQVLADNVLTLEGTKYQYVEGTPTKDLDLLDPQIWTVNYLQNLAGASNTKNQLDLFYDYRTNVELYPKFQQYLRDSKVPVLAVWGNGDPAFIPPGAEAFKRDSTGAIVRFVDAGHFALETKRWEIARYMKQFLASIGY